MNRIELREKLTVYLLGLERNKRRPICINLNLNKRLKYLVLTCGKGSYKISDYIKEIFFSNFPTAGSMHRAHWTKKKSKARKLSYIIEKITIKYLN